MIDIIFGLYYIVDNDGNVYSNNRIHKSVLTGK